MSPRRAFRFQGSYHSAKESPGWDKNHHDGPDKNDKKYIDAGLTEKDISIFRDLNEKFENRVYYVDFNLPNHLQRIGNIHYNAWSSDEYTTVGVEMLKGKKTNEEVEKAFEEWKNGLTMQDFLGTIVKVNGREKT